MAVIPTPSPGRGTVHEDESSPPRSFEYLNAEAALEYRNSMLSRSFGTHERKK